MNGPTNYGEAPDDDAPSEIDAAYRRASLADGSRPSLSARASILANAQREAASRATQIADAAGSGDVSGTDSRVQRIEPVAAANDSMWNWRAAAGLAGVAFAGVMALWLYRDNPQPAAPAAATGAVSEPVPPVARESAPAAGMLEEVVVTPERKSAPPSADSVSVSPAAAPASAPTAPTTPMAPAPGAAPAETSASAVSAQVLSANRAMRAERADDTRGVAPQPEALLRRWFPQALESDADGQQFWFVLDRNGAVLRSGQRAWSDLPALQSWLSGGAPNLSGARMESAHFTNRRGRDVELAYVWAPPD